MLDVNAIPGNLGFISAWLGRRSRLIQLRELGTATAVVKVTLPVATPTRVLLPSSTAFIQWRTEENDRALEAAFGSSRRTRMVVFHDVQSSRLLSEVDRWYAPDIVCIESHTNLADDWFHGQQLRLCTTSATTRELRNWGVPTLSVWANELGAASIRHSFAMFDTFHHRRKQESMRVYDIRDLILCEGFYPVESENGNNWAWTGSETVGTFLIPSHGSAKLRLTLFLFGATIPIDAENIDVLVDERRCQCTFVANEKIELTTGYLREGCSHRVDILQRRTVATSDGSRRIGLALHKVKVDVQ